VPLGFSNIRGAAFVDLGAVWDRNKDFQPMHLDKFKDLHMGFGFGPRLNLGYFVLKFDLAWETDLSRNSKPRYYLSLTEDF
ncbi:MAG TPA: BamA/TamA family outer membrane protein, partial [Candidatus Cloacimonadota bacterium]|nr:BamA/TamA family outer membrane protein [Candidatus Cloacimonadota bacterium]